MAASSSSKPPGPSQIVPRSTETCGFQLRPYQEPCVDSVLEVWKHALPAIITAQTGSGKTYMGVAAARRWNADYVIVVGPKASLSKWAEVLRGEFPPQNVFCITPDSWIRCGTPEAPSEYQPYTLKVERDGKGYDFYPSPAWTELCTQYRVVYILDEFHYYQKPSQRTFAVSACSRFILLHENQSRVLYLSHTPSDDTSYIPIHMYMMGIVCQNRDISNPSKAMVEYNQTEGKYELTGLEDVMKYVEELGYDISSVRAQANLLKYAKGRGVHRDANVIAGELFLTYIRDKLAFSCEPAFLSDPAVQPIYENLFCKVSKKVVDKIKTLLAGGLDEELPIVFEHNHPDPDAVSGLGKMIRVEQEKERIKEMLYVEHAIEHLEEVPKGKVVIMVQFLNSLDAVYNALKYLGYNPVRMEGCMSKAKREASIAAFQAHNLDCRVFVGTLATGGVSIDLHDTSEGGQFPRMMLIPPAMRVKDMVQAAGRVFRDGITSKPTIRIMYTADAEEGISCESRFYNKIWNKTNTIKRYHATGQNAILPCDYDTFLTDKVYETYLDHEPGVFS